MEPNLLALARRWRHRDRIWGHLSWLRNTIGKAIWSFRCSP